MSSSRPSSASLRLLLCVGALVLLAGCGTGTTLVGGSASPARVSLSPAEHEAEARLLSAADEWLGVPYQFGGTTRSGIDCSALVRAVYASAFAFPLTRSTRTQVHEGRPVRREDLRTGDLVFFRTGRDQRHVGIYLAGDRLLHASSSKDRVLVDDFNASHFQRTYWTARRFLDVEPSPPAYATATPAPSPAAPPRPVPTSPDGPARSGW